MANVLINIPKDKRLKIARSPKLVVGAASAGSSGTVEAPVTTGQIYPRGVKKQSSSS